MPVPSRNAIPASTPPRCCANPSSRSQAPSRDQRPKTLRRHPPRAQFGRDLAPLRAVVVPPDDRLDRAAQVVVVGLVRRAARLDQRRKHPPLPIRQNLRPVSIRHPDQMGTILRDSQPLVLAVFVQGGRGTLTPRAGVLLLTVAMLAVVAALLHMLVL